MSLLTGLQIIKKRRLTVASTVVNEGIRISAVGMVYTIADAIQNQDAIKSSKVLKTMFSKLESSAFRMVHAGKSNVHLDNEEAEILSLIGDVAKTAVKDVLEIGAKYVFRALSAAFKLVIVPVFRVFVSTVAMTLRLIVSNPYTLAATALIAAVWGGRKLYLTYQEKQRTGNIGADIVHSIGSNSSGGAGSGYGPSRLPSSARDMDMQGIIAEAAKRNGVSIDLALRVANIESSLNPNAGSSTSSAKGLFGMTAATWRGLGGVPGTEKDPRANADLGTKYLRQNYLGLKKSLGREVYAYEVYASHYFGPGVHAMLRVQDDIANEPIEVGLRRFNSESMVQKIMRQNPNLRGKTVGQVLGTLKQKVGDATMEQSFATDAALMDRINKRGEVVSSSGGFIIPASGTFTSPFGPRTMKNEFGLRVTKNHQGIDIANAIGTPIYAADSGVVTVSSLFSSGYGTRIDIDHGNGLLTRYGHSSKIFVKEGDRVRRGQQIAEMGNAGHSTGPHLHFEVRKVTAGTGGALDPTMYMAGFPTAVRSRVQAGDSQLASAGSQTMASAPASQQFIRRGDKIVSLKGG